MRLEEQVPLLLLVAYSLSSERVPPPMADSLVLQVALARDAVVLLELTVTSRLQTRTWQCRKAGAQSYLGGCATLVDL